jgi:prepilin-type processing-associated H-X9-DG protein
LDIEYHCPSLLPGSATRANQDYIINACGSGGSFSNGYNTGGGLAEAVANQCGCRQMQITNPEQFSVLIDRFDKGGPYCSYAYRSYADMVRFGSTKTIAGYVPVMNFYSHTNGGNYLYADGHAQWLRWQEIKARMFGIRDVAASNYNLFP